MNDMNKKEITKELYDAAMVLFKQCANHRCDECPFCVLKDEECMFFKGKPLDWNEMTEENGRYFVSHL